MIVLDTGGLYATLDESEPLHARCVAALLSSPPPRLLSPFVLAELDYLIGKRVGVGAQLALLDEVIRGAYELVPFTAEDLRQARTIVERYEDLGIGLADASVVVLAVRAGTLDLLCTDQRHFRVLSGPAGEPFRLLPFDGKPWPS